MRRIKELVSVISPPRHHTREMSTFLSLLETGTLGSKSLSAETLVHVQKSPQDAGRRSGFPARKLGSLAGGAVQESCVKGPFRNSVLQVPREPHFERHLKCLTEDLLC